KDLVIKTFAFNGKGHVLINDTISGNFVQEKNNLYVSSKEGFFFFKTERNKIVRIDTFGNQLDYLKKSDNQIPKIFDSSNLDPILFYEYFTYENDIELLEG